MVGVEGTWWPGSGSLHPVQMVTYMVTPSSLTVQGLHVLYFYELMLLYTPSSTYSLVEPTVGVSLSLSLPPSLPLRHRKKSVFRLIRRVTMLLRALPPLHKKSSRTEQVCVCHCPTPFLGLRGGGGGSGSTWAGRVKPQSPSTALSGVQSLQVYGRGSSCMIQPSKRGEGVSEARSSCAHLCGGLRQLSRAALRAQQSASEPPKMTMAWAAESRIAEWP